MTALPPPFRTAAVIGAGIAGATAARDLATAGVEVTLIEKSRGPGGRLATRRTDDTAFDHGCPWIDSEHPVEHAKPWKPGRWLGVPSMNALVSARLDGFPIAQRYRCTASALARSANAWLVIATFPPTASGGADQTVQLGPFDAIVCTPPGPQSAVLIADHDHAFAARAESATYLPCWTALLTTTNRVDLPAKVYLPEPPSIIEMAIRNNAKPQRPPTPPEAWVLHATQAWTNAHLDIDKQEAAELLRAEFAEVCLSQHVAAPEVSWSLGHRWRYAHATGPWDHAAPITNPDRLAIAGDWVNGPGASNAAYSGAQAAAALLAL